MLCIHAVLLSKPGDPPRGLELKIADFGYATFLHEDNGSGAMTKEQKGQLRGSLLYDANNRANSLLLVYACAHGANPASLIACAHGANPASLIVTIGTHQVHGAGDPPEAHI